MKNAKELSVSIIKKLESLPDYYDPSDIGNEIGIIIGQHSDEDIDSFKAGIDHGISLSKETHP